MIKTDPVGSVFALTRPNRSGDAIAPFLSFERKKWLGQRKKTLWGL